MVDVNEQVVGGGGGGGEGQEEGDDEDEEEGKKGRCGKRLCVEEIVTKKWHQKVI